MNEEIDFTYGMLDSLSNTYNNSFYLLDTAKFEKNYDEFIKAFQDIYPKSFIAYSYKTNYIPKLCLLVNCNGGYAEVVSEMEFDLAVKLGVSPPKIIYNGPYKSESSIKKCLVGGGLVNLDSISEVDIVEKVGREHPEINMSVGIRCNFDIGSSTISRFGLDVDGDEFYHVFERLSKINNISIKGLHCHFQDRCLETFVSRIDKMLDLSENLFKCPPEFINIGGGYFGKMDTSLKNQLEDQFNCKVPSYQEYARVVATKMQNIYGNLDDSIKPKLLLEPGTALVADTMKFVVKVISMKLVRDKYIATVSGSRFNILPTSNNINLPIKVYHHYKKDGRKQYLIDIVGYTCIENDYLYRGYKGYLAVGDYIVFDNVGSYSIVMKPPFILPNCAIIEYDSKNKTYNIIKRKEELKDVFGTYGY
jgi:diaminopimelate decarboxylase